MKEIGGFLFVVIVGVIIAALFALPVWWLWNALMPGLFGFRKLTVGEALEFTILIRLLIPSSTSKSD